MLDQWLTIFLVSIVLGVDAFSLSLGMGIKGVTRRYVILFSLLVGAFHIFMPLAGLYLGLTAGKLLGVWAGRIGALILAYIAFDMLYKAYQSTRMQSFSFKQAKKDLDKQQEIKESLISMLVLALSVSMDALTIGFSLGTFQTEIYSSVLLMGIIAGSMTYAGFRGGKAFSTLAGSYAQFFGGFILLGLAIKMIL